MMLSRISDYLRQCGRASVHDLATGLDTAPEALKGMLALLERKGQVRRVAGSSCSGCCKCDPDTLELYEWVR